jgi:hypothetical protein
LGEEDGNHPLIRCGFNYVLAKEDAAAGFEVGFEVNVLFTSLPYFLRPNILPFGHD